MKPEIGDRLRVIMLACGVLLSAVGGLAAQDLKAVVSAWEERLDARIGVVLRDIASDWRIAVRPDERFPMCSTFKSLLCGAVLARVDEGQESLARRIRFSAGDLVTYSPVTERHLQDGLTVAQLCEATMTLSDNTAANLLLGTMGGPAGLTAFLREIGDRTTRLDRWETELNEAVPGDPRDTALPSTIVHTLETLLYGDGLEPDSATRLRQWMIDDRLADTLIRAHAPEDWIVGDKTGAGGHGSRGIVAFIEPPTGGPYMAAIYLTESDADLDLRNRVISEIGAAMIAAIKTR